MHYVEGFYAVAAVALAGWLLFVMAWVSLGSAIRALGDALDLLDEYEPGASDRVVGL